MTGPPPGDTRISPGVRRLARLLIVAMTFALLVLAAEVALRIFLPYSFYTIGHTESARPSVNAERYGWGFAPHEVVRTGNPDTGAVYVAPVNARGWRDADHDTANPTGAFRILVLGDSGSFGAIVAAEQAYPRVLEASLRAEGYNVEVITLAYGGFATDQELEALRLEGAAYHPNLVIVQFSETDLVENAGRAPYKPFKYTLSDTGTLTRSSVPRPEAPAPKQRLKDWLLRSELFKRYYGLRTATDLAVARGSAVRYVVSEGRLNLLRRLAHLPQDHPLIGQLRRTIGNDVPVETLRALLEPVVPFYEMDRVLRMFEYHWINAFEHGPGHDTADPTAYEWRLTFALFDAIRTAVTAIPADLALFSEVDPGSYKWLVYWAWLDDQPETKAAYLSPTRLVADYATRTGVGFVPQVLEHLRARNDPHPNAAGNAAMAENIRRYVRATYNLEPYRTAPR